VKDKSILDSESKLNSGRINQKHRTRNALLEAAARLMREGHEPSIDQIADAAQVSRATAYRYFPTQLHLAGSAVLSANIESERRLEAALTTPDPAERLDMVVRAFHERFSSNEIAYRTLLRLMLQQPSPDSDTQEQPRVRASRHIHWLQVALLPIQPQIGTVGFERLIAAVISATSMEAFVALRDVCLLDSVEAGKIMRWTAQALLQTALTEADEDGNVEK
jgi:AcrR family transcriptional regulator